jgi:hypothetical protein
VGGADRSTTLDPRLAGMNYVHNGSPATFYVDLPLPGIYNLSLAMGDAGTSQCFTTSRQIQFLDGSTVVATVNATGFTRNFFDDATGHLWSPSDWPTKNLAQQVALTGTRLTVVVGTNIPDSFTPIAYRGVAQVPAANFSLSASPSSLGIVQGYQGTSTLITTVSGGLNSGIILSASGVPTGTTVSFKPQTIPWPGLESERDRRARGPRVLGSIQPKMASDGPTIRGDLFGYKD